MRFFQLITLARLIFTLIERVDSFSLDNLRDMVRTVVTVLDGLADLTATDWDDDFVAQLSAIIEDDTSWATFERILRQVVDWVAAGRPDDEIGSDIASEMHALGTDPVAEMIATAE